jgi:serine/threonine protein kinase
METVTTLPSLDPVPALGTDEDGHPVSSHAPGQLLPGGVEAWDRLGVGHRCETWLAWSPTLWGPVVTKFPRPHQSGHPRARQSLRREVTALDGNLHPGLPRLYEDGTDAEEPFVVLEYVDGPALDDELDDHGPMAADDVALLGVHLLSALRTVHARGVVHVDIKPANVLVRAGRPVLVDFGSSRRRGATQPTGLLIGSPGYAAPELEAGAPIGESMDVYGVGVTLHEARAGIPTFDPDLSAADRPTPAELEPGAVSDLINELLRTDPDARPSAEEALLAFTAIAASTAPEAWPPWLVLN